MALQKRFIIFGIIGCLCFAIGDWLLGCVDPGLIEGDIFYFIRAGHGADYNTSKVVVAAVVSVAGMCFLYPGFVHISDIAKDEKIKHSLGYAFGLCSIGWLVIHLIVAVNVFIFSQVEKDGGHELAMSLSKSLGNAGIITLCCAYLFIIFALIKLSVDVVVQKTYLKRSAVFFTPVIPMAVIFVISQVLPKLPFSYGLYTFCMNGGMLVWFVYLFARG